MAFRSLEKKKKGEFIEGPESETGRKWGGQTSKREGNWGLEPTSLGGNFADVSKRGGRERGGGRVR